MSTGAHLLSTVSGNCNLLVDLDSIRIINVMKMSAQGRRLEAVIRIALNS